MHKFKFVNCVQSCMIIEGNFYLFSFQGVIRSTYGVLIASYTQPGFSFIKVGKFFVVQVFFSYHKYFLQFFAILPKTIFTFHLTVLHSDKYIISAIVYLTPGGAYSLQGPGKRASKVSVSSITLSKSILLLALLSPLYSI